MFQPYTTVRMRPSGAPAICHTLWDIDLVFRPQVLAIVLHSTLWDWSCETSACSSTTPKRFGLLVNASGNNNSISLLVLPHHFPYLNPLPPQPCMHLAWQWCFYFDFSPPPSNINHCQTLLVWREVLWRVMHLPRTCFQESIMSLSQNVQFVFNRHWAPGT